MAKFILLIRGEENWNLLDEAAQAAGIEGYRAFARELQESGALIDAEGVTPETRIIGAEDATSDFGGYYIFTADDWSAAEEIAKKCPAMSYGGFVELRTVMVYG